jgi:ribosomal protein S18 acetylase RimI-like enzyme
MDVRDAARDDVWDVAGIHKARFTGPEYALGQYSRWLIAKFYASFLDRCVFLVHVSGERVDGFLVGGPREAIFAAQRAFVRRHAARCCLETLIHPGLWFAAYHFLRRSFLPQSVRLASVLAPHLPRLLSMAVDNDVEGTGVGLSLVRAFESRICVRYSGYVLSVLKTNQRASRFYERLGMRLVAAGRAKSNVFQKDFAPLPNDSVW